MLQGENFPGGVVLEKFGDSRRGACCKLSKLSGEKW